MRATVLILAFGLGTPAALAQVASAPVAQSRIGVLTAAEAQVAKKTEEDKSLSECEAHWDAGTHMTRQVWRQTCRRVQERFRQIDAR
ncbi:MAG: hypothetical protein HC869_24425 [Rhodospirillales bacterium]|nr:hypothetical protein [Rhodospirillales bacterium]